MTNRTTTTTTSRFARAVYSMVVLGIEAIVLYPDTYPCVTLPTSGKPETATAPTSHVLAAAATAALTSIMYDYKATPCSCQRRARYRERHYQRVLRVYWSSYFHFACKLMLRLSCGAVGVLSGHRWYSIAPFEG